MDNTIRINKYLPIAVLFFFFNGLLLPLGLLYTTLLTPFFLIWLYKYRSFNYLWLFFLISAPFALVHFIKGVDILSYLKSYILLFTVYVFALCFYQYLRISDSLPSIFKNLVLINFFLVLFALVMFFIPPLKDLVWYKNALTSGVNSLYRLKLFTYEASYYSFLLAPIAIYFYLKIILFRHSGTALSFWLVTIPLLLSLSFSVLVGLIVALLLLICSDLRIITLKPNFSRYVLLGLLFLVAMVFVTVQFFPDNVIFLRIENVFKGRDTSFSGRTFDSIYLGWKLAAQKSIFFGCGPGQIKIIGLDLFNEFYRSSFTPSQLAIPNSIGDTMAQFGLLGVLIKLSLEVYFFFRSRVYMNFYRLCLFLFMFIYQFTGSFITNVAEYLIWIMVFYPGLFPEFDKKRIFEPGQELKGLQPASH
jgi:hypothetical protein